MLRSSFILPFDKLRAGYLPLMVSLSNHARLACGAFYEAVEFGLFLEFLQVYHNWVVWIFYYERS